MSVGKQDEATSSVWGEAMCWEAVGKKDWTKSGCYATNRNGMQRENIAIFVKESDVMTWVL